MWLFMSPQALPQAWRERARPAVFVPLLPAEIQQILGARPAQSTLTADELRLCQLIGQGLTVGALARDLRVSARTIERRLAALRERFGVTSSVDLALLLAARGLHGWPAEPTAHARGVDPAVRELLAKDPDGRCASTVRRDGSGSE